ncbi:MAG: hypothetical protein AAFO07_26240 [Bacteroidota bacterium]
MNNKLIWVLLLILLNGLIIYAFVTGASILNMTFFNDRFPVGNLLVGILLTTFPMIFWLLWKNKVRNRWSNGLLVIAMILGILWWPYGRLVSGNWFNNFDGSDPAWLWKNTSFWYLTYAVPIITLIAVLIRLISSLTIKFKRNL